MTYISVLIEITKAILYQYLLTVLDWCPCQLIKNYMGSQTTYYYSYVMCTQTQALKRLIINTII